MPKTLKAVKASLLKKIQISYKITLVEGDIIIKPGEKYAGFLRTFLPNTVIHIFPRIHCENLSSNTIRQSFQRSSF